MILSAAPADPLAWLAIVGYLAAAWPAAPGQRWPLRVLVAAWCLHALALLAGTGIWAPDVPGEPERGLLIGFAPVLSFTLWLVLAVHVIESRLLPVVGMRRVLALFSAAAMLLAWLFPGELRAVAHSRWAPLHWVLGLASYGLFGTAVLHGMMLDSAEQRLRSGGPATAAFGMPLLRLERLTFRFVEAGFAVLTLALALGLSFPGYWRWDHKTVLSLLGWATFAALIAGRQWRGWRGRQATRWLYAGALLLLLAYVGSRFVMEVVLQRQLT
ncbi:cytochrome c biogenesis protein CcsA [Ideonella azotifigens]|uniref:Cytochrome c biogenesis protein CcsA n=1 Tax=Ideonella azotifigens TaxID=513160 RepID=A0ABP3VS16_9BURK|nr:cytochrome c biogenesis protein CcsA [Ideonella azotifigens]MCD2339549.1 cytochrome c biogenesis protein CcsA [Ideonella azotifigens]